MAKKGEGEKLAEDVLMFVNSFGYDSKGFAKGIARGHKTLQQSTMRRSRLRGLLYLLTNYIFIRSSFGSSVGSDRSQYLQAI